MINKGTDNLINRIALGIQIFEDYYFLLRVTDTLYMFYSSFSVFHTVV